MQPVRPNNRLNAEHALYCASSGGGKTTAVKKLGLIKATDQVAFLDPYGDYEGAFQGRQVRSYTRWADFFRALRNARQTKQGFKIAMCPGKADPDVLEQFSRIIWALGDGHHQKPLKAVFEELAKMVETSGKAKGHFGEVLTGGRKFGIHAHCLFQRGQEIPKTVFGQVAFKWVGLQERLRDAKYLSDELDIPQSVITEIKKPAAVGCIGYVLKAPKHGMGEYETGKLTYAKKAE